MTFVELPEEWTAPICIWIAAKPRLAWECVGWLEYPHSVLDETTIYKQTKTLVIGWQICHYWSPWLIRNVNPNKKIILIYLFIYSFIYSCMYIYDIIKDMNAFIEERNICQQGVVYSKKSFISTNTQHVQSIICPHNKWEAHKKPKILQHREVSVFADVCGALPCTSESPLMWLQRGTELGELPAAKGRRSHNSSRHPAILCRLPPQTSGPWRRTSKGPPHPQLALCLASSSCKNNQ